MSEKYKCPNSFIISNWLLLDAKSKSSEDEKNKQSSRDNLSKKMNFTLARKWIWCDLIVQHEVFLTRRKNMNGRVKIQNIYRSIPKVEALTDRLFIRRYSTSSTVSFVRSAMILKGMVLSSDGRLKGSTFSVEINNGLGNVNQLESK